MRTDAQSSEMAKVLIVDDEQEIREVLEEYLGAKGYRVLTAADGVSALRAIEQERPNLVLLDVRMPGMSGLELLERIRSVDPEMGVIMITANEDLDIAKRTLALGAFDYISKPFDFNYLDRSVFARLMTGPPEEKRDPHPATYQFVLALLRLIETRNSLRSGVLGESLRAEALQALAALEDGEPSASTRALARLSGLLSLALDLGHLSKEDHQELERLRRDALQANGGKRRE